MRSTFYVVFVWVLIATSLGVFAAALSDHSNVPDSPAQMIERARELLFDMTLLEQIAVVNSHPRIGENAATLKLKSTASYEEQGGDRDTTPTKVMAEVQQLNAEYERRFGFRFVVFVNRRSKSEILPILRERLNNSREEELGTALKEVLAIAEDRSKHATS